MEHQDRHIEVHKNGGWGAALFTIFIIALLISAVTYIHKTTYKSYNDLTFHAKGGPDN